MRIYDEGGQASLFAPDGSAGRMSPACSAAASLKGRTSGSSWNRSPELQTIPYLSLDLTPGAGNLLGNYEWELHSPWRGRSSTLNTGPAPPSGDAGCSLSLILEENAPDKYFLSPKACEGILRRAKERGKPLPPQLHAALLVQAGLAAWDECGLADTRTNVVFGEGARDAEVMFIGEGPGEQEDRTGRPFVGRAGQLLDDILAMIDLKREKVFIGNMVKCRPPQNRDPLNIEQEACIGYLRNQVALLKPKIIVCLGRIAAMKLIKEDFKITREHGQWIEKAGVWMMAMYHPSALLRDPRKRPESFEDLKSLQAKIREVCVRTY